MKLCLTLAAALLASTSVFAQQLSDYQIIKQRVSLENSPIPTYMEFSSEDRPSLSELQQLFQAYWKAEPNFSFIEIGRESDNLGFTHIKYEQAYKGKPIELAEWIVHTKNGEIHSMNGKLLDKAPKNFEEIVGEEVALRAAQSYVGAVSYKWEFAAEENHLKAETGNPNASYYPSGKLTYMSKNLEINSAELRLTYKFNIYAQEPLSRQYVYVDASTSEIVFSNQIIHTANTTGTAITGYSGTQTINVDSLNPNSFRLRQTVSGNGVNTFNMLSGSSYPNSVDFTDTDNTWNNVNAQLDQYATDAHWGAEKTYDYLSIKHGRNSLDNNGFALNSYVHADLVAFGLGSNVNAFWDGNRMTYGDGNSNFTPLCALDIAGHEIAHGLTSNTADLIYASESGALNESFSDIFGTAIEFYARPNRANWNIGEDIGSSFRSMSNPRAFGDPDTKLGPGWVAVAGCTPTQGNDRCGVHTNSGVQNKWFYLLSVGGSGVNGIGNSYSVTGLGVDTAAAIAFRNLTVYLNQSSDFDEARFYSIQSAIDLYGACSPQHQSVVNAWHAVGVGSSYTPGVTADFLADITSACAAPLVTSFTNSSQNATVFTWDFGDGSATSATREPSHNYTTYGQFDVKLIADGGACGVDSITKIAYIDVDSTNQCVVILTNGFNPTQTECSGKIYDTGGANGDYLDNESAVITISPTNAATVTLTFPFFDVEAGSNGSVCDYDVVRIFDGSTVNSPLLGEFCNNNLPSSITSTTGSVTIQFESDVAVTNPGFEIDWLCGYPTSPPTSDFRLSSSTTCDGIISFEDISTQVPTAWTWDFGDGNFSNLKNPIHTYTANGTYSVKLIAGNSFGVDSVIKSNVVSVNLPMSPIVTNDTVCSGQTAILTASSSGALNWYTSQIGGSPVSSGNSFTTPPVNSTTEYWVENLLAAPVQILGPVTNTIGTGRNFNGDQHLNFDVFDKIELLSVRVYAAVAGNKTIELRDNNGIVLQTATQFIPAGAFRINLNFMIDPGTDYQLGIPQGAQLDLYRNNGGVSYPYTIANKVSIKSSSATTNPTGFYYFFYNWRIKSPDCISARSQAFAIIDTSCTITGLNDIKGSLEDRISVYPNPSNSMVTIDLKNLTSTGAIHIMDLAGKLIYESTQTNPNNVLKLDVSNWSQGIYFLQVNSNERVIIKKIVISH